MQNSISVGLSLAMLCGVFSCGALSAEDKPPEAANDQTVVPVNVPPKRVSCEELGHDGHIIGAVQAWLALVDAGDYGQSWVATSEVVRCRHDRRSWYKHLTSMRKCRGKVVSRELVDTEECCEIPGLPRGQYSWIQYHTCFECGDPVCERIGLRCEADCACGGRWRLVHYSLK